MIQHMTVSYRHASQEPSIQSRSRISAGLARPGRSGPVKRHNANNVSKLSVCVYCCTLNSMAQPYSLMETCSSLLCTGAADGYH